MSYVEDLFAVNESVRNGRFQYPYRVEEVRPFSVLPSLLSKTDDENDADRALYADSLLAHGPFKGQRGLRGLEKTDRGSLDSGGASLSAASPSENVQEVAIGIDHQVDSSFNLPIKIDERVYRLFTKTKELETLEVKGNLQDGRLLGSTALFVHFPTEFSLRLFERYVSEMRSVAASGQSQLLNNGQSVSVKKSLLEKFNHNSAADLDFILSVAKYESCAILRSDHLENEPPLETALSNLEFFIVLFLDNEKESKGNANTQEMGWKKAHEVAEKRLQRLCGNCRQLEKSIVYRVLFPLSSESQDLFISAQLQSLGVDLSAPVSDEMIQVNEALSLLAQDGPTGKRIPGLLDDQLVSFVVFEIAAARKRIDSLEKMIELLSGFDAVGWILMSDALSWLDAVQPRRASRRIIPMLSEAKGVLPFHAEDPLGIEMADRIRAYLNTGSSLCASLFFEKEPDGDGARTVALREINLLAYAIARWIVGESPHKYLKDKTACLDTFGRLLDSAGFSKEFIGSLFTCTGDCLRATLNRPSLARISLEHLYEMANQSTSSSLSISDVIALTLRSDCDASGFGEESCWRNFFLKNVPSEFQATAISNENRFGQVRLGNMKALSAFADEALARAKSKANLAVESNLEEAFNELECAVWLQMISKQSLGFTDEPDDTIFLAMLECAVWVDAENVHASFRCGRSELLSQSTIDRLIGALSGSNIRTSAYYFASLALWYYSGFQNGHFISRDDLAEIVVAACGTLTKSQSQIEKASALRVLSTVPLDIFSQSAPNKGSLERAAIDMLLCHSDTDPCCLVCALSVLSRIGSSLYGSTRFVEMALRGLSIEGHFNNMIVNAMLFETHLRTKYSATLRSYSEGSLRSSSYNDVAYMIDHGYAIDHRCSMLDSEKILVSLTEKTPSLFPTVNLFLHYLQNEGDPEKAFCFYRKTARFLNPSEGDLHSASDWWGDMGDLGHPEGLLVSLLLAASGWPIRKHSVDGQEAESECAPKNALGKIAGKEFEISQENGFKKESMEETVRRHYGDAVLNGIKSLSMHPFI